MKALTREEAEAIYDQGKEAVVKALMQMSAAIEILEERVAKLERQINANSQNSSKPPSSDGFRPAPRSLRRKSGRRSGGQEGHDGNTLKLVLKPDHVMDYWPERCEGCGRKLKQNAAVSHEARQVHDIPPIKVEVTEHRAMKVCCCGCGKITRAAFPEGVMPGAQYGGGVSSIAVYLMGYQLLPLERTQEALSDILGCRPSEGTLVNMRAKCAQKLGPINAQIKEALIKAAVEHFDETGLRVVENGKSRLWWLHSASTATLTSYAVDPKRGAKAMQRMGILPEFKGVMVHDALSSYGKFAGKHALCNAHLLRELTAQAERYPKAGWPGRMMKALTNIKKAVDEAKSRNESQLDERKARRLEEQFIGMVNQGLLFHPREDRQPNQRGRPKASSATNLIERMRDQREAILRFMYDFSVPFDNNQAERDLRMMKVKQKVSGCFRSVEGAQIFAAVRGYVSTVRKQGHNALVALRQLFDGAPVALDLG